MNNEYILKGQHFLEKCVFQGLAHSYDILNHKYVKPYPEVTGYVIKYFCDYVDNIPRNIINAANYLLRIQDKKTGGFPSFDNKNILYSFDTSQILIGLCAIYKRTNKDYYKQAAIKSGEFLIKLKMDNGAIAPTYDKARAEIIIDNKMYSIWNGPWSGLMCKITEGFQSLYEITLESNYLELKKQITDFYVNSEYIECTHPLGYWLEGLLEGGKEQKVDEVINEKILPRIQENGYIPYKQDLEYAYVSGIAQIGIILFKRGFIREAQRIRDFLRLVQSKNKHGGLFQYCDQYGNLDYHIHTEINSWGTKYFCELEKLMLKNE